MDASLKFIFSLSILFPAVAAVMRYRNADPGYRPFLYLIFISLINVRFPLFLRTGVAGIIKSLLFALLIVLLTGLLEKRRLRLKL